MEFNLNQSINILQRTPVAIETLLGGLNEQWTHSNEGENTWSPFDIVGHLIHGEKTDWIPRMQLILSDQPDKTFTPFDRFAQLEASKGKTITQLLSEFKTLRHNNIALLKAKNLSQADLNKKGIHPALGEVTLAQLLATWTAHDLGHIAQMCRVMARQYKQEVGPWKEYLSIVA